MREIATEPPVRDTPALSRGLSIALVSAGVVGLAVLSLARQGGVHPWHTVWAEDGAVFFHDNAVEGARALVTTYSGYLVTLPRLVALAAGIATAQRVSEIYAVGAALFTGLLAMVFFWLSDFLISSKVLRGVLAASFVLQPLVAYELLNNVTNTIWPLTVVCFVALLRQPRGRADTSVAAGVAFLAIASQVLCVVWLPIAGLAIWRRPRDRRVRIVIGAYALGLALQAIALVTASTTGPKASTDLFDLPSLYAVRVLGSALLGERWMSDEWIAHGAVVAIVVTIFLVGALVVLARRAPHAAVGDAAIAIGASLVFFGVAVGYRGTSGMALHGGEWTQAMSRFVFVALELFLLGAFILIDRARMGDGIRRVVIGLVAVQLAVVGIGAFHYTNGRSLGPVWEQSVDTASSQCSLAPPVRQATIALSPQPTWATAVPCTWLRRHG